MGLFGWVSDALFGDPPKAKKSGIYPEEGAEKLGGDYNQFLSDVLSKDSPEWETPDWRSDEEFLRESGLLRDMVTTQTGESRQRLSDSATASGFLDSGYVGDQLTGIDREGTQAYAQGLVNIMRGLKQQRRGEYEFDEQVFQREIDRIFPWLGAAAGEELDIQNINIGSELQQRGQDMGLAGSLLGKVSKDPLFGWGIS